MVLAGHALGSFSLGARLAALYTLTGAATAVWRGRRMDRGDLRRALQRDGVIVAVVAGAVALCVEAHGPSIVAAGLAVALGTALAAIPGGYRAMVSSVVPASDVGAAYAMDAVGVEACFVFGPAVAAMTAWFAGPAGVFVVMAVCALAGSLAAGRLPSVRRSVPSGGHAPAPHRIPVMVGILAGTVSAGVSIGVLDATFPALAVTLGTKAAIGGIFITVMALGSGTGGLLFGPRVAGGGSIGRRAAILLVGFGIVTIPMAAAHSIWVVVALAFLAGAPFALMTTSASVLIQRSVDEARTTEAFSLLNAGLLAGAAIGSALASSLLGPAGARTTLLLAGAGPLIGGAGLLVVITRSGRPVSGRRVSTQRSQWSQSVGDQ
jgi:MFS family permease